MFKITRRKPRSARVQQTLRRAVRPLAALPDSSAGCWIERLEDRQLLAAPSIPDLAVPSPTVPVGKSLILPLAANDADGEVLTSEIIVSIPDAALESAIRAELGKAEGEITDADMQSLTYLGAWSEGITDLTGLEHAANLQTLYLGGNSVSSLTPLAGLANLMWLDLSNNQISDFSPITGLTELNSLNIGDNQPGSIDQVWAILQGLPGLWDAGLDSLDISDLTPVASLTNLSSLSLSNNLISDFSPLAGMVNLSHLSIGGNQPDSLAQVWSILHGLPGLSSVGLDSLGISDLTPLADLTNLTGLELNHNAISNLGPLSSLTGLTRLGLWNNQVSDIGPLAFLVNLDSLTLWQNHVSDLGPLAGLVELGYLDLEANAIADISVLADLPSLYGTYLTSNYLDLTPGSDDMQVIEQLEAGGAWVYYEPQNTLTITDDSGAADDRAIVLPLSEVGAVGGSRTFWLNNSSSQPLVVNGFAVGGADAGQFQVVVKDSGGAAVPGTAFTVPAGAIYQIQVSLAATSAGDKAATIGFSTSSPNLASVQLHVSGLARAPIDVSIPDPTLEAAIRSELGKLTGVITDTDMASLQWLYVWGDDYGVPVADLAGLEYAVNLWDLEVPYGQVADLSPLAGLTNLEYLYLSGNRIVDLAPLSGLTRLAHLSLGYNRVSDISPLAGLENLGYVSLYYNYLDLTAGSGDMQVITQLESNGAYVYYEPQSELYVEDDSGDAYDLAAMAPTWDVGEVGPGAVFWLYSEGGQLDVTNLALAGPDADQFRLAVHDPYGDLISGNSFTLSSWDQYRIEVQLAATTPGLKNATVTFNTSNPNQAAFELSVSGTAEMPVPICIPDPNLEAAIREELDKPAGIISARSMQRLQYLHADGQGITDLAGLQHAVNLENLYLADNRIADVSPLAGMHNLESLDLSGNRITDLSPLSSTGRFATLQLFSRRIGSLAILTDMNTRYGLGIWPETIADLADAAADFGNLAVPAEQVTDLLNMMSRIINLPEMLDFCKLAADPAALAQANTAFGMGLSQPQIDGMVAVLSALGDIPTYGYFSRSLLDDLGKVLAASGNMASLLLFCDKFGDEGVLTALNAAGGLGLSPEQLRGAADGMQAMAALAPHQQLLEEMASLLARLIKPWDALNGQEELLVSAEGLTALNAQYGLGLSPQQILTLSSILGEMIDASGNDLVADFARSLMPLPDLRDLDLSWNPLTDIGPIASFGGLTELDLGGTRIADFSPVFGLRGLTQLDLSETGFTDITSLAHLTELDDLDLAGNGITDISALVYLRNLRWLDLESNQISDISVIPALDKLGYLDLSDNLIADLSAFLGAAKAQALQAFSAKVGTVAILTDLNAAYGLDLEAADLADLAALMSGLGTLNLPAEQIGGLVSALSRIVNLPQVLSYLSVAGNPFILATLNLQYGLGLTFAQRSGISAVFTALSAVTISDTLFAQVGTILAKPGYMASLFLACQKFGRADVIMGVSGTMGEPVTATEAAELAESLQQIAALKPQEALFIQLASVMLRITNPQKVFDFLGDISPVAILNGINSRYALGLSPLQISLASSGLADMGNLYISDRILADMGAALTILPELEELELQNNPITDISALAGLPDVYWLDIARCLLDITPGSAAMQVIDALVADGVEVEYRPQLVMAVSTAGPDAYYAIQGAADAELHAGSAPGGALARSLPLSDDPGYVIRFNSGEGADTLTFDASAGVAAAGMFEFDGGPDNDTLRITGADGLSLQASEEGVSFDGMHWLRFRNVESILLDSLHLNALSLFDEGWLPLAPGGRMFSVQSLAIDFTSALDIADNALTIAADDTNRAARLSAVQQAIFAARNGGPGIFSSTAAWNQSVIATLDPSGNIVIRLALSGDATLDGYIDGDDFFALDRAFLAAGGALVDPAADLNSDGTIDGGDFFLLDLGFLNNPVPHVQLAAGPAQISPFSTASIVDEVLAEEGVAPVFE